MDIESAGGVTGELADETICCNNKTGGIKLTTARLTLQPPINEAQAFCIHQITLYLSLILSFQSKDGIMMLLAPALLCHEDTALGTHSPLLGSFLVFHCVFMA